MSSTDHKPHPTKIPKPLGRNILLISLLCLGLIIVALIQAPAWLITEYFLSLTNQIRPNAASPYATIVRLSAPTGSIWSGQATLHLSNQVSIPLRWQVAPLALLSGKLAGTLWLDDKPLIFELRRQQGRIESLQLQMFAHNFFQTLSAHLVLNKNWASIEATGIITLSFSKISINPDAIQCQGTVLWESAALNSAATFFQPPLNPGTQPKNYDFGRVTLLFTPEGNRTRIQLDNAGGAYRFTGNGYWDPEQPSLVAVEATPLPSSLEPITTVPHRNNVNSGESSTPNASPQSFTIPLPTIHWN